MYISMYVLNPENLKQAEVILKGLFPEALKVYGCLYNINRGKPLHLEVIADAWPRFNVIVCKPKLQDSHDRDADIYSIYSRDTESVRKLFQNAAVIDWNKCTLLAGIDMNHVEAVKELAMHNNAPTEETVMYVLTMNDARQLKEPARKPECRVSTLTLAHAELVNSTWKHGGNSRSYISVVKYISNYPTCCVLDKDGNPISWLLLYQHCALGLLYTMPEHRQKGYAKMLVSIMVKHLLEQGYPIYCFVEEGNEMSFQLFTSLGFTYKPQYRAIWLQINDKQSDGL